MKQNTHIYLASLAMELLYDSIDNFTLTSGKRISGTKKREMRTAVRTLQHLMQSNRHKIKEAAWAPDLIIKDMNPYHVFKLAEQREFPDHDFSQNQPFPYEDTIYYRFTGSGAPYKIDHLANLVKNMIRLRSFNDIFTNEQITYLLFMLTHYIADLNVPMHCDLRDDPPKNNNWNDAHPKGAYMNKSHHAKVEALWDQAATHMALELNHIQKDRQAFNKKGDPNVTAALTFTHDHVKPKGPIAPKEIKPGALLNTMLQTALRSKALNQHLFPIKNPTHYNKEKITAKTREIFKNALTDILSVWIHVWC